MSSPRTPVEFVKQLPNGTYQRTGNLVEVTGIVLPAALGQQLMANSLPVVIASDQGQVDVVAPGMSVVTACSGQITVAVAGTAVQGPNVASANGFFVKAMAANTGNVYLGNDGAGDVTNANGFELAAGDVILVQVDNLNQIWFDAAVGGEKFCWLRA